VTRQKSVPTPAFEEGLVISSVLVCTSAFCGPTASLVCWSAQLKIVPRNFGVETDKHVLSRGFDRTERSASRSLHRNGGPWPKQVIPKSYQAGIVKLGLWRRLRAYRALRLLC